MLTTPSDLVHCVVHMWCDETSVVINGVVVVQDRRTL